MKTTAIQESTYKAMQKPFGFTSIMQTPKVTQVTVSCGVGRVRGDKKRLEVIVDRIRKITGQQPAERRAKKSIAQFKTRTGDLVGYQVTLRGQRADDFLNKLIHIVLPRVKDFRGLNASAIDEMGNMSIGFREHTVFPETSDEDARDVFGLAITITTTAKDKEQAEAFLRHIGLPLKK
ncbi:50S ribosomal protein L5 [Candidatus Kaiserbacteria bacterium]|nr:50S ribosomal protein L5 [Candidatus Kaiserbacteria bacterium]